MVCYGIGAVGSRIAKFMLEKEGLQIVGAIDADRNKVGQDLGELLELNKKLGVTVSDDIDRVLSKASCDVVVHATSSYLRDVYPQITPLARYGVNVISTCEELSYPYLSEPELAKKLDNLGLKYAMTFLGTGINPGFLMDTLVITLTGACQKIEKITAQRVMNAATRRVPFQKKIGAGLTVDEFKRKMATKEITGHVGLEQSIGMIAAAIGWDLDKIAVDTVEPVVAHRQVESEAIKVKKGQVAGLRQTARGIVKRKDAITLDFQAYIGAKDEHDSIIVEGLPLIHQTISPCVHGDYATVAMIVNMIPKVMNAHPGLLTMKDLPVPSAAVEDMRKYLTR